MKVYLRKVQWLVKACVQIIATTKASVQHKLFVFEIKCVTVMNIENIIMIGVITCNGMWVYDNLHLSTGGSVYSTDT